MSVSILSEGINTVFSITICELLGLPIALSRCSRFIDVDGSPVGDEYFEVNAAGFTIHSALHQARQDVECFVHLHSTAGMAVAAMECGLLPLNQISMQFYNRVAYHEYEGISLERVTIPSPEVCEHAAKQHDDYAYLDTVHLDREWTALLRLLERDGGDHRC